MISVLKKIIHEGLEAFHRYYSIYPGYVMDNNDPDGMGRLKLMVPNVYGDNIYDYWALPRNVISGEGWGVQVTPQKNSLVWVEFRHGNPKLPVWSHGYFKKGAKPSSLTDIKKFWFLSPSGHLIMVDDGDNTLRIKDADGNSVIVSSKGISLVTDKEIFLGSFEQAAEKAVMGDTLKNQLTIEKARVDAIISALQNSPTGSQDGGALYKAMISTALSGVQAPDYSNILSNKVSLDQ
jgi:uncharacterized protein involved in type VI secretion and phage assembly